VTAPRKAVERSEGGRDRSVPRSPLTVGQIVQARSELDAELARLRAALARRHRSLVAAQSDGTRRWAARALADQGRSQREIARRLGINRRTVARLIAADEPPRYRREPRGSMLDPLEPVMRSVLRDRPGIGAPGMTEILRREGYRGSVDLVRRRLRLLRRPG
jgi:hypothetical protein